MLTSSTLKNDTGCNETHCIRFKIAKDAMDLRRQVDQRKTTPVATTFHCRSDECDNLSWGLDISFRRQHGIMRGASLPRAPRTEDVSVRGVRGG